MTAALTVDGDRNVTDLALARRLRTEGLRIRRSWPRADDHLLLELIDADGIRTAAQWFADPHRARHVATRTPGAHLRGPVVLQPNGADRRLTLLTALITAGHRLVGHRAERRAVVSGGGRFIKIVPASKLPRTAAAARRAAGLGIGAPEVLDTDAAGRTLTTAALPGESLTAILGTATAADACTRVGARLAEVHAVPPAAVAGLPDHGLAQERTVLGRWLARAASFGISGRHQAALSAAAPPAADSGRRVLVHRDFHDGQILIDGDRVGILDFDLMAVGDPALDLANFLAHLELRAAQGVLDDPETAREATLAGYRPEPVVWYALPGYLDLARTRLRAVYAFRNPELPS